MKFELQQEIVAEIISAKASLKESRQTLHAAIKDFDHVIDGKDYEVPELENVIEASEE